MQHHILQLIMCIHKYIILDKATTGLSPLVIFLFLQMASGLLPIVASGNYQMSESVFLAFTFKVEH